MLLLEPCCKLLLEYCYYMATTAVGLLLLQEQVLQRPIDFLIKHYNSFC